MGEGRAALVQRFRNRRHTFVVGGFCAVLAVVVVLSAVFWEWLSGGESGSTTIRNVALIVAGALALLQMLWRSFVADRQAKTTQ